MPEYRKLPEKRTPKTTMTLIKLNYPGHDLWYRVREEVATGKKWYQPYCPCGYRSEKWYPARGQRVERIWTYEHLAKTSQQGTLTQLQVIPPSDEEHSSKYIDIVPISDLQV